MIRYEELDSYAYIGTDGESKSAVSTFTGGGGGTSTQVQSFSPNVAGNSSGSKIIGYDAGILVDKHAYKDNVPNNVGSKFISVSGVKKFYYPGVLSISNNDQSFYYEYFNMEGGGRDTLVLSNGELKSIDIIYQEEVNTPPVVVIPPVIIPPKPYAFIRLENLSNQNLNATGKIYGDVVVYFCSTSYFDTTKLVNYSGNLLFGEDTIDNGNVTYTHWANINVNNTNRLVIYPNTRVANNTINKKSRSNYYPGSAPNGDYNVG